MRVHNRKNFIERRKELRRNQTQQEEVLWGELRGNKLGYRFRRQHSIGGYILDFYCFKKRLIVEIDGESHDEQYDNVRDSYFADLGYRTLRIRNKEIDNDLEKVIKRITLSLRLGEGGEAG